MNLFKSEKNNIAKLSQVSRIVKEIEFLTDINLDSSLENDSITHDDIKNIYLRFKKIVDVNKKKWNKNHESLVYKTIEDILVLLEKVGSKKPIIEEQLQYAFISHLELDYLLDKDKLDLDEKDVLNVLSILENRLESLIQSLEVNKENQEYYAEHNLPDLEKKVMRLTTRYLILANGLKTEVDAIKNHIQENNKMKIVENEEVLEVAEMEEEEVTEVNNTEEVLEVAEMEEEEVTEVNNTEEVLEVAEMEEEEVTEVDNTEEVLEVAEMEEEEVTEVNNTEEVLEVAEMKEEEVTEVNNTEEVLEVAEMKEEEVTEVDNTEEILEAAEKENLDERFENLLSKRKGNDGTLRESGNRDIEEKISSIRINQSGSNMEGTIFEERLTNLGNYKSSGANEGRTIHERLRELRNYTDGRGIERRNFEERLTNLGNYRASGADEGRTVQERLRELGDYRRNRENERRSTERITEGNEISKTTYGIRINNEEIERYHRVASDLNRKLEKRNRIKETLEVAGIEEDEVTEVDNTKEVLEVAEMKEDEVTEVNNTEIVLETKDIEKEFLRENDKKNIFSIKQIFRGNKKLEKEPKSIIKKVYKIEFIGECEHLNGFGLYCDKKNRYIGKTQNFDGKTYKNIDDSILSITEYQIPDSMLLKQFDNESILEFYKTNDNFQKNLKNLYAVINKIYEKEIVKEDSVLGINGLLRFRSYYNQCFRLIMEFKNNEKEKRNKAYSLANDIMDFYIAYNIVSINQYQEAENKIVESLIKDLLSNSISTIKKNMQDILEYEIVDISSKDIVIQILHRLEEFEEIKVEKTEINNTEWCEVPEDVLQKACDSLLGVKMLLKKEVMKGTYDTSGYALKNMKYSIEHFVYENSNALLFIDLNSTLIPLYEKQGSEFIDLIYDEKINEFEENLQTIIRYIQGCVNKKIKRREESRHDIITI